MGLSLLGALGVLLAVQAPQAAFPPHPAQATLAGQVQNAETGAPLPGAGVALPDLERTVTTDTAGRYVIPNVPAGPQHLSVRLIGYAARTLHALVPASGALEINVSLRPEPFRLPTVEVRPPIALRGVEAADSSDFPERGSSMAAAWNHPLLAEPDALQALGGGEVSARPESPSGLHVRGGAADQTGYLLDGIPVFSPYHAAGVFSAWNPDALAGVELAAAAPSPAYPHALSGAVTAATRAPGARFSARGGVSSTQARLTLDGPLGAGGAGYLVSFRSGFPALGPESDPSYLQGRTGDWLAKLEVPAFAGRLRLLGYDGEDDLSAAVGIGEAGGAEPRRNAFEWHSRSLGAEWRRGFGPTGVRVAAWRADTDAESDWAGGSGGAVVLSASRADLGLVASVERASTEATTLAGVRVERIGTSYHLAAQTAGESWEAVARLPHVTAFARHSRTIGRRVALDLGGSLAVARGDVHAGPRARIRWKPLDQLTLWGTYARLHQFAQSLRNPESVVGAIFPADLYLGAGAAGVPVARSDQAVVAAEYRPAAAVRLGIQAYARNFEGLVLVAPQGGDPFATAAGGARPFGVGSGTGRGVSLDGAISTARLGLVASYGYQRLRLRSDAGLGYVPDHGTAHLLEAGAIVFPTASSSIRLGVATGWRRRTTGVVGGFEWEACNLLDRGCEFAGSPHHTGQPLGAISLPAYARVDLGLRQHFHVRMAGREVVVALFGTVTNLLGRRNVLTLAADPITGEPVPIEMRPLAPLVVGLDWRF